MSDDSRQEIYALFPELGEDISIYGPSVRANLKGHEAKVLAENPDFLN